MERSDHEAIAVQQHAASRPLRGGRFLLENLSTWRPKAYCDGTACSPLRSNDPLALLTGVCEWKNVTIGGRMHTAMQRHVPRPEVMPHSRCSLVSINEKTEKG
ncbi:MAG: hypothetical protein LBQ54_07870 [Planctomycetaceae bacterium]|nr:hypothetical protein [Planctomycetaceae bacterium]